MSYNNNYNSYNNAGGLGTPGSGFASRGKANHIKRLSVAPPSNINAIHEDEIDNNPTPRTSRSHLLANLRTAPRPSSNGVPASAPYHQHSFGFENQRGGNHQNAFRSAQQMPQTAATANFPSYTQYGQMNHGYNSQHKQHQQQQQMYMMSDQILAPPAMNFVDDGDESVDAQLYQDLVATNFSLMQRQQQLQQQLRAVTARAQNLDMNDHQGYYGNQQMNPATSLYNQQMQSGVQPIVTAVPGQPGLFAVYNPMTGQQNLVMDPSYQQLSTSPPVSTPGLINSSPDSDGPGFYGRDMPLPSATKRTFSPPAKSPSPRAEVEPLPQPSANAYRPGHRKSQSMAQNASKDFNRFAGPKSAGIPPTPMTGTFGPGMNRAGEHPIRQPRNPPPIDELRAAPTTKHEGSKNFVTRQRRQAVSNLVKAGKERRTGRAGSNDSGSPLSDLADALADIESGPSLSGHSSRGSLRGPVTGAIGSERKEKKQREESAGRRSNAGSISSEEGTTAPPKRFSAFSGFSPVGDVARRSPFA